MEINWKSWILDDKMETVLGRVIKTGKGLEVM